MNPEKFCLVTTEAVDHIFLPDREVVENNGGTTLFYRKAVQGLKETHGENDIDFVWITPPKKTEVYIYPSQNYGYGINGSTVDPNLFDEAFREVSESAVIISTTLKTDFDLSLLRNSLDKIKSIFIDVQGFTRDGKKHEPFVFPDWLLQQENLVFKVADEEFQYINIDSIITNPRTTVLHTKGERGVTVMHNGTKTDILPTEVVKVPNERTRGAGDTFFFNFAINYLKSNNVINATKQAEQSVIQFLKGGLGSG